MQALCLRAVPARAAVPARRVDQAKRLVGAHLHLSGDGELEVAPDGEDIADAAGLEDLARLAAAPADLVAGRPGRLQPGVQDVPSLLPGDLALGREGVPGVEPGSAHALGIGDPLALHVQFPVGRCVSVRSGVAGVDRDDRVLDPARGAGVLPAGPCGVRRRRAPHRQRPPDESRILAAQRH
jgi:hypothetical protein